MILWKIWGHPDESLNLTTALRKFRKQFNRLFVEIEILYRFFYDDCGKLKNKQLCVPETFRREFVFHLHSSTTAGLTFIFSG